MLHTQKEKDNFLLTRLLISVLIAAGMVFNVPFWYKGLILVVGLLTTCSIIGSYLLGKMDLYGCIVSSALNFFVYLLYMFYNSLPFVLKVVAIINFILDNVVNCYAVAFKGRNPLTYLQNCWDEDEEDENN